MQFWVYKIFRYIKARWPGDFDGEKMSPQTYINNSVMELIINQNGGEKSHGVNDVTEGPSAKEIIKCFFGKSKGIIYLCTNIIYLQKDRQKRQLVFVFFFSLCLFFQYVQTAFKSWSATCQHLGNVPASSTNRRSRTPLACDWSL